MWNKVSRRQAYYFASAAFLISWIMCFVAIINRPYIGLSVENVKGQWVVTASDLQGEGYKLGVRVGDLIVSINNDDIEKYRTVQIWSQVEGISTIEVQKIGQGNERKVRKLGWRASGQFNNWRRNMLEAIVPINKQKMETAI